MLFFSVSKSLPNLIWWFLSIKYSLAQKNRTYNLNWFCKYSTNSFCCNNFEFMRDGLNFNQNCHHHLLLLFFSLITELKDLSSANFSNFWEFIRSFRTLTLGTMASSDYSILPFISFVLFYCLRRRLKIDTSWSDDCYDFCC